MRFESLPIQLVHFFQLITISLVHRVEPIHELRRYVVAELLVEFA